MTEYIKVFLNGKYENPHYENPYYIIKVGYNINKYKIKYGYLYKKERFFYHKIGKIVGFEVI